MPVTNYIWDVVSDNVLMEKDDDGDTIARYVQEPELYGEVISQERDGEIRYYHYDGEGNTSELTDENENVTDTYEYSAFGEEVARTGTTENPFGYKGLLGYYTESETGSINLRARQYSPNEARWLSTDPIPIDMTPYIYVGNDPVNLADPSGLCYVCDWIPLTKSGLPATTLDATYIRAGNPFSRIADEANSFWGQRAAAWLGGTVSTALAVNKTGPYSLTNPQAMQQTLRLPDGRALLATTFPPGALVNWGYFYYIAMRYCDTASDPCHVHFLEKGKPPGRAGTIYWYSNGSWTPAYQGDLGLKDVKVKFGTDAVAFGWAELKDGQRHPEGCAKIMVFGDMPAASDVFLHNNPHVRRLIGMITHLSFNQQLNVYDRDDQKVGSYSHDIFAGYTAKQGRPTLTFQTKNEATTEQIGTPCC